jgi:hypothetical protein
MSAESVALIRKCAECKARWLPANEERWLAYLTDDEPAELAFYCPPSSTSRRWAATTVSPREEQTRWTPRL